MSSNNDSSIQPGDRVAWNWGSSHAEGVAAEVADHPLAKKIKGKTITRKGDPGNPAVFVERKGQKNPTPVLKKASELHKMEEGEDIPSTQHVDTERQRRLHGAHQE